MNNSGLIRRKTIEYYEGFPIPSKLPDISLSKYIEPKHSYLFKAGYSWKDRDFLSYYNFVKENEFKPRMLLLDYQEEMLKKMIRFCYRNVPYYHRLFKNLDLEPEKIRSINDLEKIPILTKEVIRAHYEEFMPVDLEGQRYVLGSTGGSTGQPLQYRMTKSDETLGLAMMYANWGYAGYNLGDKVAIIAGSSLLPNTKFRFINNVKAFMLNEKRFSSFDLSSQYLDYMAAEMNRFKPDYIRGYASSIFRFVDHIREQKIKIEYQPQGIFTTAEVLFEHQRTIIEEVMGCKVFNQYGMNDGGVSAYECSMHNGLHIDMLRSMMEVVDEEGSHVEPGKEGHILATSLHNFAFPFIRYDSKDMGILSSDTCSCGRDTPLLDKVVGRVGDFIHTPEGKQIHGEFFSHIFWKIGWTRQFQIVQNGKDHLTIRIEPDQKGNDRLRDLEKIKDIILNRIGSMQVEFEVVENIKTTSAGKWKFVVRETL
jgi:phenylacetate-CoA ligase